MQGICCGSSFFLNLICPYCLRALLGRFVWSLCESVNLHPLYVSLLPGRIQFYVMKSYMVFFSLNPQAKPIMGVRSVYSPDTDSSLRTCQCCFP